MIARRAFVSGVAALVPTSLAVTPRFLSAQVSAALPLIAILEPGPSTRPSPALAHMREGVAHLGWLNGRTARFEIRYSDWQPDRMLAMARELVALRPAVLYTHSNVAVSAARQATNSIPIVVGVHADLLGFGIVKSLARPGGNVTGMTLAMPDLDRKRLELLKRVVGGGSRFALLFVPGHMSAAMMASLEEAARILGIHLWRMPVSEPSELESVFKETPKERVQALFISDTAMLAANADRIAALAIQYRLPGMSQVPRFAESGGLISYGADVLDLARRSSVHVDKILRGAKPEALPVEQPSKVDLVVNLTTARTLGISIPDAVILQAARVIE